MAHRIRAFNQTAFSVEGGGNIEGNIEKATLRGGNIEKIGALESIPRCSGDGVSSMDYCIPSAIVG